MIMTHGGDIYAYPDRESLIDFSVNLNPMGMPPKAMEAAKNAVGRCAGYPDGDCRDLRRAIARWEGVKAEQVLCGNGAADLIFRIAFGLRPSSALVLAPTFSEYRQALESAGCRVTGYPLSRRDSFAVDRRILPELEKHELVLLCNPNNPTGQVVPGDLLDRIVRRAVNAGCVLVIDECFVDFLPEPSEITAKGHLGTSGKLLILKAFTKLFSIAGLRLGYLLGTPSLLEQVERGGPPWNVSIPAQAAGIAALEDKTWAKRTRRLVEEERRFLTEQLEQLGMWVCPSRANYLLFQGPKEPDLCGALLEKGFLIRPCGDYEGLDDSYYRIAVRKPGDNRRFIEALSRICGDAGKGRAN